MKVDLHSILKFLKEKNYDANLQETTEQAYVVLKRSNQEFPLFFRIFTSSELLQLLAFMPCQVKPGVHSDVARLLHYINKGLDIPGFGMDEDNAVVFYRCMLPIPGYMTEKRLLESYLKAIELICEVASVPVLAVAKGLKTYDQVVQNTKKSEIKV